jgi:hypothetical protein
MYPFPRIPANGDPAGKAAGSTIAEPPPDEPSRAGWPRSAPSGPDLGPRARAAVRTRAVFADPRIGRRIARAYAAAPVLDPRALPAYRRLREELCRQFDFLTRPRARRGLGIDVEISVRDPYPRATEMIADLRDHGRLRVHSTVAGGNPHPFFTADENDLFRAIHDAFGHAATGSAFDRDGEEVAWRMHSCLLSPLASAALATETRGQTSARVWSDTPDRFPVQKVFILPAHLRDDGGLRASPTRRRWAATIGGR